MRRWDETERQTGSCIANKPVLHNHTLARPSNMQWAFNNINIFYMLQSIFFQWAQHAYTFITHFCELLYSWQPDDAAKYGKEINIQFTALFQYQIQNIRRQSRDYNSGTIVVVHNETIKETNFSYIKWQLKKWHFTISSFCNRYSILFNPQQFSAPAIPETYRQTWWQTKPVK